MQTAGDHTGWAVILCGFIVWLAENPSVIVAWLTVAVLVAQLGYLFWRTKKVRIECKEKKQGG